MILKSLVIVATPFVIHMNAMDVKGVSPLSFFDLYVTFDLYVSLLTYMRHFSCFLCRFVGVSHSYGVATVSSIDKIIGLFCRISSLL